jgi:thymidylate synthase ThyX
MIRYQPQIEKVLSRLPYKNLAYLITPQPLSSQSVELNFPNCGKIKLSFQEWMDLNEQMYCGLRKANWIPEDARQVLPTAIKSQIVVTTNFREWRNIFKLRTAPDAHWEIREVMTNLLKEVKKKIPIIFDDIL